MYIIDDLNYILLSLGVYIPQTNGSTHKKVGTLGVIPNRWTIRSGTIRPKFHYTEILHYTEIDS